MAVHWFIRKPSPRTVNRVRRPRPLRLKQIVPAGVTRTTVFFPFAPTEVTYGGLSLNYETIERSGLKPLMEATNRQQRTIDFSVKVADKGSGGLMSVEDTLAALEKLASDNYDLLFIYGLQAHPTRLRMTNLTVSSLRRNLDGEIMQAEVSISLKERVSVSQQIVALAAIEYEPPRRTSEGGGGSDTGTVTSTCDPALAAANGTVCCDPTSPYFRSYLCDHDPCNYMVCPGNTVIRGGSSGQLFLT